jgi:hypothetical protein
MQAMIDRKLKRAQNIDDRFLPEPEYPPYTQEIVVRLDDEGNRYTNVPHVVVQHSPSGYSWSYNGSGPSDLALNLSHLALYNMGHTGEMVKCWDGQCFALAYEIHHYVKSTFIAKIPKEGGSFPYSDLVDFISGYKVSNENFAEDQI